MVNFKNFGRLASLFILIISLAACKEERKLPIYGQREAKLSVAADGSQKIDTIYHTIPAFSFLNQDSTVITQDAFKDKIYIADFFFTSCSTICPVMHRNLKVVYDEYLNNPDVMFLSHTIDFKYDKPSVLKKYAQKLGVDTKKWEFVYGSKESVYGIAEKDYLVAVDEDSSDKDGYIHQGWLVLIDKDKKMRGAYDGTDEKQVDQLKKDVLVLLKEYQK